MSSLSKVHSPSVKIHDSTEGKIFYNLSYYS